MGNSSALPFFVNCGLRIQDCLEQKNRFVHNITMSRRIVPLFNNVIFMISVVGLLHSLSCRFVVGLTFVT